MIWSKYINIFVAGYLLGAFFNIDNADTTTTAGRNVIAVSAITNEMLYGWFHFYVFEAHMKLINRVVNEDCDALCSEFTLPLKPTDDIIKHMLGSYYEGYYKLSALKNRVDKLTDNQKRVLYMKNNLMEFLNIPEIDVIMKRLIVNTLDDNMIVTFDDGSMMMNPFSHHKTKGDIAILSEAVQKLAFGMYYYEGDYIDGEYKETLVEIVTDMPRRKIANVDTDSAVTVVSHEKYFLLDKYKDIIGDKKDDFLFTEGTLPMLMMTIYLAAVRKVLKDYSSAINIDDKLIPMIDLECEVCMEQQQLSISKKTYVFTTVIKDFMVKQGKLDAKGFKFKKSDANAALAEQVQEDIKSKIMCHIPELNFKDLIESIHKNTLETIEDIRTDDFIINKKSVVKVSDPNDISWGDTRMKAVRLWDRLFPETPIDLPGSFGILRIRFDKDMVQYYKSVHNNVYQLLVQHVTELYKFGLQNKVINKVAQIMDVDDDDNADLVREIKSNPSDKFRLAVKSIISAVHNKYDETEANYGLYDNIRTLIYDNGLSATDIKALESLFKLPKSQMDPDVEITKKIDRLALPMDINTVPDIVKENNYQLLDIEASSEYEHLLSPLLNSTSISVVKNKSKNAVVTNVLQVF